VSGGPLIVSGDRQVTRAAMMARVRRAASSGFAAQGVGPGDCVALLLRNDFAFLEASLAATMLGGYAVPINWHWKADEVAYLLRDCDAKDRGRARGPGAAAGGRAGGLKTLVVHTPPEVAAAYHLHPRRRPAPGEDWEGWLSAHCRNGPATAAAAGEHDLHLRHDRPAQGRAAAIADAGADRRHGGAIAHRSMG
jgi:long-chain acyl-CoA synthetase